jgi:hypothetical protein
VFFTSITKQDSFVLAVASTERTKKSWFDAEVYETEAFYGYDLLQSAIGLGDPCFKIRIVKPR